MAKAKKPNKKAVKKSTPSSRAKFPSWLFNQRLHCIIIFLFASLLYLNTLGHKFTQDDAIVITENMYTTQGLAGIPGILQYDTFKGFFKVEGKDKLVSGGRYRPFTLLMFALEWQIFKSPKKDQDGNTIKNENGEIVYEGNPFIGHFINIILYGLTCVLIYLLMLKLLSVNGVKSYAYFVALATAMLYAAHPLHTEAVANIKGRDEIMTMLGSLAAAYFCLKAYLEYKISYSIIAGVCFFIGLLSKENAITFLGVIPLMFFIFTKANNATIFKHTIPLLAAAVLFLIIRGSILGWSLGEPPKELMNNPFLKIDGNRYVPFSAGEKIATIQYTLGKYLQLLFVPHPLTHDYYPRHVDIKSLGDWKVLLSMFLYLAMLIYALVRLPKKDPVSFGILFYLGTLSIVSNYIFAVGTNMSERFVFMPSLGFCFLVAYLLYKYSKGAAKISYKKLQPALFSIVAICLIFGGKTIMRNSAWSDNYTLFTTDIKVSSNSAKLQNSVGAEKAIRASRMDEGPERDKLLREAIAHLEIARGIHPNYENTYLQLGNANTYLKEYDKAIEYYGKVLSLDPDDVDAMNNRGIAYRDSRRFAQAIQQFEALRGFGPSESEINEKIAYTYEDAGKFYSTQKQFDQAIDNFNKALAIGNDKAKYTYFLGVAYANLSNFPKAIELFNKALDLADSQENKANIYGMLSQIHQQMGDNDKAAEYQQKAQNPEN